MNKLVNLTQTASSAVDQTINDHKHYTWESFREKESQDNSNESNPTSNFSPA